MTALQFLILTRLNHFTDDKTKFTTSYQWNAEVKRWSDLVNISNFIGSDYLKELRLWPRMRDRCVTSFICKHQQQTIKSQIPSNWTPAHRLQQEKCPLNLLLTVVHVGAIAKLPQLRVRDSDRLALRSRIGLRLEIQLMLGIGIEVGLGLGLGLGFGRKTSATAPYTAYTWLGSVVHL